MRRQPISSARIFASVLPRSIESKFVPCSTTTPGPFPSIAACTRSCIAGVASL